MNSLNLRPAFYRPREGGIILSGWQATTTGDIYTLDKSGQRFELVAGARPALGKGSRVEFERALDLYPTDYIEERERGIVSHVDGETGTVSVLLEGVHNGLGDNTLTLTPHEDEEALAALSHSKARKGRTVPKRTVDNCVAVLCGLATLLVTAPLSILFQFFAEERNPAIFFAAGVAWVAVAFGQRAALVLAAVTPFIYNLLIVPPQFSFTPWQSYEWFLAATYFGIAVTFPWTCSRGTWIVRRALGLPQDI